MAARPGVRGGKAPLLQYSRKGGGTAWDAIMLHANFLPVLAEVLQFGIQQEMKQHTALPALNLLGW